MSNYQILLLVLVLAAGPQLVWAGGRASTEPPGMSKVSTPLATTWREQRGRAAQRQWTECFVKIEGGAVPDQIEQLTAAGFHHRSVIPKQRATILTGKLQLRNLPRVAALPFVESIEGAVRVHPKGARKVPVHK